MVIFSNNTKKIKKQKKFDKIEKCVILSESVKQKD